MSKSMLALISFIFAGTCLWGQKEGKTEIHRQDVTPQSMDSIYQWRIKQEKLNGAYIPKDLNDCFKVLDQAMEDDVKEEFKAFTEEELPEKTFRTIGSWITFRWELREGSRITAYFNKMGVPHPKYMVALVLTAYHRQLNNKPINIKELVTRYRDNWQEEQQGEAKKLLEGEKQ